jgi:hypothetical protein
VMSFSTTRLGNMFMAATPSGHATRASVNCFHFDFTVHRKVGGNRSLYANSQQE